MKKLAITSIAIGLAFIIAVFVIALFAARGVQTQHLQADLPAPSLKELARSKGIEIGNYAALKRLGEGDYTSILTSQLGFVTIDGEPNWQFNDGALRPTKTTFDYTNIDTVMAFAKSQNMPVQMHHLVWGEEKWLPDWLKNGNYSPDQLLDIIHNHIQTVAGHYQGQVREWTVVNEAFTRANHDKGLSDWWLDHIGNQSYIDKAFTWAHQADPNAKLLMNDFDIEGFTTEANNMYSYIKGMKARDVPIDGIGMQMHIDGNNPPKKEDVIKNMQRFAALGLGVYVTEFDVTMNDYQGTDAEKQTRQAAVYHDMLRACIESGVCKSFALLGITDKETWYNEMGFTGSKPLPFDDAYNPKPAFWALREALRLP